MDKHCANCIYRCYITAGLYCCDYIGYTGHARSLICPPGARCTEKKTVQRTPPNPNGSQRLYLTRQHVCNCTRRA